MCFAGPDDRPSPRIQFRILTAVGAPSLSKFTRFRKFSSDVMRSLVLLEAYEVP
jgi:hypothetical protein